MYRKKEKNRLMERAAVFLLSVISACLFGCGGENTVVLETLPAMDGTEDSGAELPGQDKVPEAVPGGYADAVETGSSETGGAGSEQTAVSEPETEVCIQVHVCGAVNVPGVYSLPAGSRVFEAVDAAGGMAEDAAEDYLNLADAVSDGDKVRVPFLTELSGNEAYGPSGVFGVMKGTGSSVPGDLGSSAPETDGLVDLNHADKGTLMTLPGIGEAKAEAILSWREEHGAFEKTEDVMQVPGIKEAAYEKLKDKVTVKN